MNSDLPDQSSRLPSSVPRTLLKQATESIIAGEHTFDSATEFFGIEANALHRFYRQYVRSVDASEQEAFDLDDDGIDDVNEEPPVDVPLEEKLPKREFQPLGEEDRGNFSQNWDKAQENVEDEEIVFTPLAESFSNIPVLRRLVRKGEINSRTVFEMCAIIAIIALLAVFLPILFKKPVEDLPTSNAQDTPEHNLPIDEGTQVIRQFLDVGDWKARVAFVRDSARIAPILKDWYSKHPDGLMDYRYIFFEEQLKQKGRTFLRYTIIDEVNNAPRPITVACEEVNGRMECLIDWEEFVVYQPGGDWDYFIESRPETEYIFRVDVQFSDYYNYSYMDQERYIALSISIPGSNRAQYLYLDRSKDLTSEISNALIAQKPKGDLFQLTLKLTYDGTDPKERDVVRVVEMVSPSWLAP